MAKRGKPPINWKMALILIGISWAAFFAINTFYNVAPYSKDDITAQQQLVFFLPLGIALFFTFNLFFRNRRRGVLASILLLGLLFLRLYDLTSLLNVLLLLAFISFLEWYCIQHHKQTPDRQENSV